MNEEEDIDLGPKWDWTDTSIEYRIVSSAGRVVNTPGLLLRLEQCLPYLRLGSRNDLNGYSDITPDLYEEMKHLLSLLEGAPR